MPTRFTVAIPTHDRRETVLLAVRSALSQTRPPEQVLVLCDGCGDGTADALRAARQPRSSRRWSSRRRPATATRTATARSSSLAGDVILWLADDDLLTPDHLERIGELWDTDRFDLVQSDGVIVHENDALEWFGAGLGLWRARCDRLAGVNSNPMASVSISRRGRTRGRRLGPRLERAGDWDLWKLVPGPGRAHRRSAQPTVLHFRATGREQLWDDRVRQNTSWLARMARSGGAG